MTECRTCRDGPASKFLMADGEVMAMCADCYRGMRFLELIRVGAVVPLSAEEFLRLESVGEVLGS